MHRSTGTPKVGKREWEKINFLSNTVNSVINAQGG